MNNTRTLKVSPSFAYVKLATLVLANAYLGNTGLVWEDGKFRNTGTGSLHLFMGADNTLSAPANDTGSNTLDAGDSFSFSRADFNKVYVRNASYTPEDVGEHVADQTALLAIVDPPANYIAYQDDNDTVWMFTGSDATQIGDWTEITSSYTTVSGFELSGTPV